MSGQTGCRSEEILTSPNDGESLPTALMLHNRSGVPCGLMLRTEPLREGWVMTEDRHIYGEVNSKTGLKKVFAAIRRDVEQADSRPALTELYKRAGYLMTLTHAPSWQEKFGKAAAALRKVGADEFHKTARKINRRAA